jgi:hypothetical protein
MSTLGDYFFDTVRAGLLGIAKPASAERFKNVLFFLTHQ